MPGDFAMLHTSIRRFARVARLVGFALAASLTAGSARAQVQGIPGTAFALTAKADRISTPDGNSLLIWGFSIAGRAQYPGPTLIVNEGDAVSVSVTNQLPPEAAQRVSLTFPGQQSVTAACTAGACLPGPIALEATQGATVTYRFTASRPGTFHYTSGSQPDLQIEMGLVGALIVRPANFATMTTKQAYGSPESAYDREYLFLLSEMDSRIHDMVERLGVPAVYQSGLLSDYFPNYWFINGRNAPDTMAAAEGARFPTQPYNCLPTMHPGERLLMRVIGGGHDLHPFHHHGNHARVIAVDGHLRQRAAGPALDLSHEVFTIQSVPGQTVDALFTWTGQGLGWDVYGDPADPAFAHGCSDTNGDGFDDVTREYCADHGKKIPVVLPDSLSTDFGGFWSGSPFLGTLALLPPGQGGLNPDAGYTFMWHSHTEKEITNFDIFPGGMMTMLVIVPRIQ
jgi:FtsP/CotA-like multicopper oxidase with cupredoxin domain